MRQTPILQALLALSVAASSATGQTGRFRPTWAQNQVTVVDTITNHVVIGPNGRTLTYATPLHPQVQFVPQSDGFDLTFTYTNSGSRPELLGYITIPGLRFGRTVNYRDFQHESAPATADHHDRDYM